MPIKIWNLCWIEIIWHLVAKDDNYIFNFIFKRLYQNDNYDGNVDEKMKIVIMRWRMRGSINNFSIDNDNERLEWQIWWWWWWWWSDKDCFQEQWEDRREPALLYQCGLHLWARREDAGKSFPMVLINIVIIVVIILMVVLVILMIRKMIQESKPVLAANLILFKLPQRDGWY